MRCTPQNNDPQSTSVVPPSLTCNCQEHAAERFDPLVRSHNVIIIIIPPTTLTSQDIPMTNNGLDIQFKSRWTKNTESPMLNFDVI